MFHQQMLALLSAVGMCDALRQLGAIWRLARQVNETACLSWQPNYLPGNQIALCVRLWIEASSPRQMLRHLPRELILIKRRSSNKTICLQRLFLAQALHEVRVALPLALEEIVDDLLRQLVDVDAACEVRGVRRRAEIVRRLATAEGTEAGRLPISRGRGALRACH